MVVAAQRSTLFSKEIPDVLLNNVFSFVEIRDLIESEKVNRAWRDAAQKLGHNRKHSHLLFLLKKVQSQIDLVTLNFKHVMSLPFTFDGENHHFHLELHGNFAQMQQVVQRSIDVMTSSIQHSYALPVYEMSFVEEDSTLRCLLQLQRSTLKIRLDRSEKLFKPLQDRKAALLTALSPASKRKIAPSKSDDQIFTLRKLQIRIAHIIGTFVKAAPKSRSPLS